MEYTEEGSSPFELGEESDIEDISGEKVQLDGFNIMYFVLIKLAVGGGEGRLCTM